MVRFIALIALASLAGCAPPRWTQEECRDQPNTWNMSETELAATIRPMSDTQLLDLAACNTVTSHPSNSGIPAQFVEERSTTIAGPILSRLSARDEGLISMTYIDLLETAATHDPKALSSEQRKSALTLCRRHYTSCGTFE